MCYYLIKILIIIYYFLLIPALLGFAWNKIMKKVDGNFFDIYIHGYLLMFAFFFVFVTSYACENYAFSQMVRIWSVISVLLPAVALVYVIREIPDFVGRNMKKGLHLQGIGKAAVGISLILIVISILFVVPSYQDDTTETVMTTLATDTIYVRDSYTDDTMSDVMRNKKIHAPIQMLYAVVCRYTGIHPAKMIHYVLPVFFLLLFYAVYAKIACQLFEKDEKKRSIFLILINVLYMVSIYTKRDAVFSVFQNIWMPETLLYNCIMPFAICVCVEMMNRLMHCKPEKTELILYACSFFELALAAQSVYYMGSFMVSFLFVCAVIIVFVRKGYHRCRNSKM